MKITTTTAELFFQREGVASNLIRKPENLPECLIILPARSWADRQNVDKFGSHVRKDSGMGFLLGDDSEKRQTTILYHMVVSHGTNGTGNR